MNIFFLNPPFIPGYSRSSRSPAVTKSGTLYYPIWLAYAAGYLEGKGHNVKLVDAVAEGISEDGLAGIVAEFETDLLVCDTSTPSIENDLKVTERLKFVRPGMFTLLVGTHPSALPDLTLRSSISLDAVCIGEYEDTIAELAEQLEGPRELKEIRGLSFRYDGGIFTNAERIPSGDLDRLPLLNRVFREHLDYRSYFYSACHYPATVLITSRGCMYSCNFCLYPQVMFGRRVRERSLENIFLELEFIRSEMPEIREIVIEDDTFTCDIKRVREFCEGLISRKLRIRWSCNARADLDADTLKIMSKAGCRLMFVGFENASPSILNDMNKSIDSKKYEGFMNNCRRNQILVHGAFIIGHIGETENQVMNTVRLATRLNPDTAQFFPPIPYPGTKLYTRVKEQGFLRTDDFRSWLTPEGYHDSVITQEALSSHRVMHLCRIARRKFYLRPLYILNKILQVIFYPGELTRIFKAFKLFYRHLLWA